MRQRAKFLIGTTIIKREKRRNGWEMSGVNRCSQINSVFNSNWFVDADVIDNISVRNGGET